MIIDAHMHIGAWDHPDFLGRSCTVSDAVGVLDDAGFNGAFMAPTDQCDNAGLLADMRSALRDGFAGPLWFCAWARPGTDDVDWISSNRGAVTGIKIHPSLHRTRVIDEGFRPALELADRHGLVVLVHDAGVFELGPSPDRERRVDRAEVEELRSDFGAQLDVARPLEEVPRVLDELPGVPIVEEDGDVVELGSAHAEAGKLVVERPVNAVGRMGALDAVVAARVVFPHVAEKRTELQVGRRRVRIDDDAGGVDLAVVVASEDDVGLAPVDFHHVQLGLAPVNAVLAFGVELPAAVADVRLAELPGQVLQVLVPALEESVFGVEQGSLLHFTSSSAANSGGPQGGHRSSLKYGLVGPVGPVGTPGS